VVQQCLAAMIHTFTSFILQVAIVKCLDEGTAIIYASRRTVAEILASTAQLVKKAASWQSVKASGQLLGSCRLLRTILSPGSSSGNAPLLLSFA